VIIFDLKCAEQGHVFEGWFGSSADYEDQQERGLVSCPVCGSGEVVKAVMAPAVRAKGNSSAGTARDLFSGDAESVKRMLAALAAEQKRILAQSEHVGERFADEARAIHIGDADARPIHGRATREQAESLLDEGISVAPLPFPVIEPGDEN
jgi:hypothetical protein